MTAMRPVMVVPSLLTLRYAENGANSDSQIWVWRRNDSAVPPPNLVRLEVAGRIVVVNAGAQARVQPIVVASPIAVANPNVAIARREASCFGNPAGLLVGF